jgi:four helix bundle protein
MEGGRRSRKIPFSVAIIKWVRTLPKDLETQLAARQLIRAATSVGANVEEAVKLESAELINFLSALINKNKRL